MNPAAVTPAAAATRKAPPAPCDWASAPPVAEPTASPAAIPVESQE